MNSVKEDWVIVNNVPTHVCKWERRAIDSESCGIVDGKNGNQPVILFLCGNPGIIRFYYSFLQALFKAVAVPIWLLSHAGHENNEGNRSGDTGDWNNVAAQVEHKAEFIKQHLPLDRDIYIIGHSFGAKIIVELLKKEVFRKRIQKCYLLFPTLQRIGDTRNGHNIKFFIKYFYSLIMLFSFIFTLFPFSLQSWLIKMYFTICGRQKVDPGCITAVVELINPTTLSNVFNLAANEMDVIRELDKEVIKDCADKFRIYFGTADGWAPLEHHYDLLEQVPAVDSRILDSKYEHCFMLETGEEFATELSERIKDDIQNVSG